MRLAEVLNITVDFELRTI